MVQLDPEDAVGLADRERLIEPAVGHPQVVQHAQRGPSEVTQLRMRSFRLELGDDHDREHDFVLVEPDPRGGVGQQDGGVENEGPTLHAHGLPCGSAGRRPDLTLRREMPNPPPPRRARTRLAAPMRDIRRGPDR